MTSSSYTRPPLRWALRIACVIAMVVATHRIGYAEPTGAVLVTGRISDGDRASVEAAIITALRRASWTLSVQRFSSKEVSAIAGCLLDDRPWPCLTPLVQPRGVNRLIVAEVKIQDAANNLILVGEYVTAGDHSPAIVSQRCDRCDPRQLSEAARQLTERLLLDVASLTEQTTVEVQTVPVGGEVTLDEHSLGLANGAITHVTYPGPHRLITTRRGYRRDERTIDVPEGKTTRVVVELVAEGGRERSWVVPAVVAGVGVGAMVGGLWVSATAPDSPTGHKEKYVYSTPGLVVAGVGAVTVGVAFYLWRRGSSSASSAPTVSLLPGGGTVGWTSTY